MSAIFNPYGFSHQQKIGGKPRHYTFQFPLPVTTAGVGYANNIAAGDPVSWDPIGGGFETFVGIPTIPVGATTRATLGTFLSVSYTDVFGASQLNTIWVANTPVLPGTIPMVTVDCDPNVVWQTMCNGTPVGLNAVTGASGRSYNYTFAGLTGGTGSNNPNTPNLNTKTSTACLDIVSGAKPAAWSNCIILGLAEIPNNNWTDPYPEVLVIYNNHQFKPGQITT